MTAPEKTPSKTLQIATSPHLAAGHSVDRIMFNVVLALLPTSVFAVYAFGITGLLTLLVATASAVLAEHLYTRIAGQATTVRDWSAVITGLLYGLTLPPGLPLWMNVVGAFFGIVVAKSLFGGLGFNAFNPALVGRAFLQAAFPVSMTTWVAPMAEGRFGSIASSTLALPFTRPVYDVVTGATPLSAWKFDRQAADAMDLLLGTTSGSVGETCTVLILLGGAWLVWRKMMNWRITVSILATVAIFAGLLHVVDPARYASAEFMLFSGGLMLGAVFMATDMVGSPMTNLGVVVYGAIIGVLVVLIRTWGGMPEGVMYAILLGNALSSHIDGFIQPRVYGTARKKKEAS